MSSSASHVETGPFTYEAIAALVPTLEEQQARAASSSPSTTASTPESKEECRALEAEFLVDLYDDDPNASPSTSTSTSTSADSLAEQSSGPPTAPASATAATTPDCHDSPTQYSLALSPLSLKEDLVPAAPEPVARYPSALDVESSATTAADFEQAPPTYPTSNLINGLALRALLQTANDFRPRTPMLSPNARARLARWEKDVNFHEPDTDDAVHLPNDDSRSNTNGAVHGTQEPLYTTPTPTPGSGNGPLGPAPVLLAVNEEMAPAVTGAVAHYAPALGVGASATTTPDAAPPSDVVNAQTLRALLQAYAHSAAQAGHTHNHGYPTYAAHQGAYFSDASLPPAHAFPLLGQPQSHFGALQGYPAAPPTTYPQPGAPHPSYYGAQVPQPYQHGYYNPYAPNGLGLVLGGATAQYAVPGFPMQYQSAGPVPHVSSKPLSATGRPNEAAGLHQRHAAGATSSSKRKRPVPDWKGKGKAKAVGENVDADATCATVDDERDDDDGGGAPPAKKPRRAARGSKGAARQPQPMRKNRSYTLLPDGKYKCSHCGDDKIKNKNKHRQMCGLEGPLRCPFCGLELVSRRHDSLKSHLKFSECKNNPNAVAAAAAIAASHAASAGTELTPANNDSAQETQGENDSGAEEDVDAYRNVAGPSSVTLEDIPKPKKKATKRKAAKKN